MCVKYQQTRSAGCVYFVKFLIKKDYFVFGEICLWRGAQVRHLMKGLVRCGVTRMKSDAIVLWCRG